MPNLRDDNRPRRWRRPVAMTVACALFAAILLKPAPARANSQAFVYAGIGVGVYLTAIIVATLIVYKSAVPDSSAIPIDSLERDDRTTSPVHTGTHCAQRDGQVTLFCW